MDELRDLLDRLQDGDFTTSDQARLNELLAQERNHRISSLPTSRSAVDYRGTADWDKRASNRCPPVDVNRCFPTN